MFPFLPRLRALLFGTAVDGEQISIMGAKGIFLGATGLGNSWILYLPRHQSLPAVEGMVLCLLCGLCRQPDGGAWMGREGNPQVSSYEVARFIKG